MKVSIAGKISVLGNTPLEILEQLQEENFLGVGGGQPLERYLAALGEEVQRRHGQDVSTGGASLEERAEKVIQDLCRLGLLDLLED